MEVYDIASRFGKTWAKWEKLMQNKRGCPQDKLLDAGQDPLGGRS